MQVSDMRAMVGMHTAGSHDLVCSSLQLSNDTEWHLGLCLCSLPLKWHTNKHNDMKGVGSNPLQFLRLYSLSTLHFGCCCVSVKYCHVDAGNLWLNTGDERVDLGLCVKHGAKSMCVPDYVQAQPDNTGWTYSQALIGVIEQYKVMLFLI